MAVDYGPLAAYASRWSPTYRRTFERGGGYQGYLTRQLARLQKAKGSAAALAGPVGYGTVLQDLGHRYGHPITGLTEASAIQRAFGAQSNALGIDPDAVPNVYGGGAIAGAMNTAGRSPHVPPAPVQPAPSAGGPYVPTPEQMDRYRRARQAGRLGHYLPV